ncbi:MAG: SusC/RagA family TonB-linked outer membrane protein, partial [Bacteroidales bacterium]|nr:SusC/RagA family TonB-linked outer membrane protein [Bacteroidales bacterium]
MNKIRIISVIILLLACSASAFAQKIKVSGVVQDESGQPLPGAAVIDKQNSRNGVVTDLDGKYSITVPANGFLEFSSLGFTTQLESVNERTVVNVTLKSESTNLDELVVIAYGTAKKSDLTGAVATVDMKSIESVPATSIESALQGRIAGADFVSTTGEPGSSASIQIRGARSISAGNEPLIVVDGVVDAVSDLSELNPSDIKSISVLKDVSSTSLYGSRGANGVILITTNSPSSSNFSVKLKASAGLSHLAGSIDIMNAEEFAEYCNMQRYFDSSLANKPQTKENSYFIDPSTVGEGTDWIKTLSQIGSYQDYNLSLSGGTKVTRAEANFGYNNTRGVVIGSGFQRFTGRVLVESHPFKWLRIGIRMNYANRTQDFTTAAITGTDSNAAIYLAPFLNKEDTWNSYGSEIASGGSVFNNPYITATSVTNQKNMTNLNVMPYFRLFLGKFTQFVSKFSWVQQNDKRFYYAPSTLPVAQRYQTGGRAVAETYISKTMLSESTLTFNRTWKRSHTLDLLAGFTAERKDVDYTYINGSGYLDDNVTAKNMASLLDLRSLDFRDYQTIRTRLSVLARVNYNFKKRYFLTL